MYFPELPIEPPESIDYDRLDEIFWEQVDMDYDEWAESKVMNSGL